MIESLDPSRIVAALLLAVVVIAIVWRKLYAASGPPADDTDRDAEYW